MANEEWRVERLSSAGEAVHAFLKKDSVPNVARLLRQPRATAELAFQALTILIRRKFVSEPDIDGIKAYVGHVLEKDGTMTSDRARLSEALMQSSLSMRENASRIPSKHQDVGLILLVDLVRSLELSDARVFELVRTAEWRLLRLLRKPGHQTGWYAFGWRRFRRETRDSDFPPGGAGPQPRTLIGQILKALALYDFDTARSLPDDRDREGAAAVVDAAFATTVRERFRSAPGGSGIEALAARASARGKSPLISSATMVELITEELSLSAHGPGFDRETEMQAKIVAIMEIVEERGLFPSEVGELVLRAERSAQDAGYNPTGFSPSS